MVLLIIGTIWKKSGIIAIMNNSVSLLMIKEHSLLKHQETLRKTEREWSKFSSKTSIHHNFTSLFKLFSRFTLQEELLVVLLILVTELPTLFQFMKVTHFHMLLKETILLVEISLDTLQKFSEKPDQLSLHPLNSKSLETSKKNYVTLLLTSRRKCKNMKIHLPKNSNMNSQMETSSPLVTNNSDARKLFSILLEQ